MADWFEQALRTVHLSLSEGLVESRRRAADELASGTGPSLAAALGALVYGDPINRDLMAEARQWLNKGDPSFPQEGAREELKILAIRAVESLFSSRRRRTPDIAALSILCRAFQGLNAASAGYDLENKARSWLESKECRVRRRPNLAPLNVDSLTADMKEKIGEFGDVLASDPPQAQTKILEFAGTLGVALNDIVRWSNASVSRVDAAARVLEERAAIHEWLAIRRSRLLDRSLESLDPEVAAATIAVEVHELTAFLPGPPRFTLVIAALGDELLAEPVNLHRFAVSTGVGEVVGSYADHAIPKSVVPLLALARDEGSPPIAVRGKSRPEFNVGSIARQLNRELQLLACLLLACLKEGDR